MGLKIAPDLHMGSCGDFYLHTKRNTHGTAAGMDNKLEKEFPSVTLEAWGLAWMVRDKGGRVSQMILLIRGLMIVNTVRWAHISVWLGRVEYSVGCYDKQISFNFFPLNFILSGSMLSVS